MLRAIINFERTLAIYLTKHSWKEESPEIAKGELEGAWWSRDLSRCWFTECEAGNSPAAPRKPGSRGCGWGSEKMTFWRAAGPHQHGKTTIPVTAVQYFKRRLLKWKSTNCWGFIAVADAAVCLFLDCFLVSRTNSLKTTHNIQGACAELTAGFRDFQCGFGEPKLLPCCNRKRSFTPSLS